MGKDYRQGWKKGGRSKDRTHRNNRNNNSNGSPNKKKKPLEDYRQIDADLSYPEDNPFLD